MNDKKANHHTSNKTPYVESTTGNGQISKGKVNQVDRKCSIHIHSKRKRLADPDGISAKAAIDGLRKAGVCPDDSAKFIKEVTFSQELSKEDETVITVVWE